MIRSFQGIHPKIDPSAFVAETAVIIGDVEMGPQSSIWYNCVARGDVKHHPHRRPQQCSGHEHAACHT